MSLWLRNVDTMFGNASHKFRCHVRTCNPEWLKRKKLGTSQFEMCAVYLQGIAYFIERGVQERYGNAGHREQGDILCLYTIRM